MKAVRHFTQFFVLFIISLGVSASEFNRLLTISAVFDRAESIYTDLFPEGTDNLQTDGWMYRYYSPTNLYVGVNDSDEVYLLTDELERVGTLSDVMNMLSINPVSFSTSHSHDIYLVPTYSYYGYIYKPFLAAHHGSGKFAIRNMSYDIADEALNAPKEMVGLWKEEGSNIVFSINGNRYSANKNTNKASKYTGRLHGTWSHLNLTNPLSWLGQITDITFTNSGTFSYNYIDTASGANRSFSGSYRINGYKITFTPTTGQSFSTLFYLFPGNDQDIIHIGSQDLIKQ